MANRPDSVAYQQRGGLSERDAVAVIAAVPPARFVRRLLPCETLASRPLYSRGTTFHASISPNYCISQVSMSDHARAGGMEYRGGTVQ